MHALNRHFRGHIVWKGLIAESRNEIRNLHCHFLNVNVERLNNYFNLRLPAFNTLFVKGKYFSYHNNSLCVNDDMQIYFIVVYILLSESIETKFGLGKVQRMFRPSPTHRDSDRCGSECREWSSHI